MTVKLVKTLGYYRDYDYEGHRVTVIWSQHRKVFVGWISRPGYGRNVEGYGATHEEAVMDAVRRAKQ